MNYDCIELLRETHQLLKELKELVAQSPEWIPVSSVAESAGLTSQAVRKRLLGGDFEPEVDFKYSGSRIYIARSAVSRLKRIRK